MSPASLARVVAIGIGTTQILANALLLVRGITRLPGELVKENASARIADLLGTAWIYGMLANLSLGVVLVLISGGLRTGEVGARAVAAAIGIYYVIVGGACYWGGPGRHAGFLVFSLLGLLLLGALWFGR